MMHWKVLGNRHISVYDAETFRSTEKLRIFRAIDVSSFQYMREILEVILKDKAFDDS